MNNQPNARQGRSRSRGGSREPRGNSRGGRSQSQASRAAQGMVNQMYNQQRAVNNQRRGRPPPRRIDDSSEPLLRLVRTNKAVLEGLAARQRVRLPATAGEFLADLNFPGLTKAMRAVADQYMQSQGIFENTKGANEAAPAVFLYFDRPDFTTGSDSPEVNKSVSIVNKVATHDLYFKSKQNLKSNFTVKEMVSAFAFFFAELERQLVKYMQRHLASKRRWATYVNKVRGVAKVSGMELPEGTGNIEHDKKVYSDFLNRVAEEALAGKEGPLDTQNAQALLMPRILSILDPRGENPLDLAEKIKAQVNKKYWHLFLEATPALKANARKARNYRKRQARSEAGGDDRPDDPMILVHQERPKPRLFDEKGEPGNYHAAARADSGIAPFSRLQSSAAAPVPTAEPPLAAMPRFVSMRYD